MEYIGNDENGNVIQCVLFTCWRNCVSTSYEASTSAQNTSTEQPTQKKEHIATKYNKSSAVSAAS